MNGDIDLDYDEQLSHDAEQFGIAKCEANAQGGAVIADTGNAPVEPPVEYSRYIHYELKKVLFRAELVYGATNSAGAGAFCVWATAAKAEIRDKRGFINETLQLSKALSEERSRYCWRIRRVHVGGANARTAEAAVRAETKATWLEARLNAVICACNVIHAVLGWLEVRGYGGSVKWIKKAHLRADATGGDCPDQR